MSRLIRDRDTAMDGFGYCCTCRKRFPYQELDAGHWHPRGWWSVRWDEHNIHAQCLSCNRPLESWNRSRAREMFELHEVWVLEQHGQAEVDRLNELVLHERRGLYEKPTLVVTREFCYGLAANCRAAGLSTD